MSGNIDRPCIEQTNKTRTRIITKTKLPMILVFHMFSLWKCLSEMISYILCSCSPDLIHLLTVNTILCHSVNETSKASSIVPRSHNHAWSIFCQLLCTRKPRVQHTHEKHILSYSINGLLMSENRTKSQVTKGSLDSPTGGRLMIDHDLWQDIQVVSGLEGRKELYGKIIPLENVQLTREGTKQRITIVKQKRCLLFR